jgi:hypothetical protein
VTENCSEGVPSSEEIGMEVTEEFNEVVTSNGELSIVSAREQCSIERLIKCS